MSTHQIPYPSDFDVNYHEAIQQQRVERARRLIDVGDVLAKLDDLVAAEPDPAKHPCYSLVLFFLDRKPRHNIIYLRGE